MYGGIGTRECSVCFTSTFNAKAISVKPKHGRYPHPGHVVSPSVLGLVDKYAAPGFSFTLQNSVWLLSSSLPNNKQTIFLSFGIYFAFSIPLIPNIILFFWTPPNESVARLRRSLPPRPTAPWQIKTLRQEWHHSLEYTFLIRSSNYRIHAK